MLSKTFLRTVHLGHINTDRTVCSFTLFKCPSLQLSEIRVLYKTSAPLTPVALQSFVSVKLNFVHAHKHICKVELQQEGLPHGKIYMYKYRSFLTTSTACFIQRFVYFLASANHFCRIYLRKSHETATLGVYSAERSHSCLVLRAMHH